MRIHAIARHEFETQKRSNTIDNSSYNLYSYIFSELHTSALGALGRRFESFSPMSFSNKSQLIPSSLKFLLHAKFTQNKSLKNN